MTLRNAPPDPARSDDGPFRIYRLCPCFDCSGTGKTIRFETDTETFAPEARCPECRGEGKTLDLVATCETPADLGMAIYTLGTEGEFDNCPIGVMHREQGETGTWLVLPWLASPRNVSDAGRILAKSKTNR